MTDRRQAIVLALASAVVAAFPAAGARAGGDAQGFVQGIGDRVVQILQQDLPHDQIERQLHEVWLQAFDVEGIGRAILGRNWQKATEAQRAEYMQVFPQYVARLYAIQFAEYSGETFSISGSRPAPSGDTEVNAQIVRPGREPVRVDFSVQQAGADLKIRDVKVEGVSLLVTKRSEFNSVVAQRGIDGLIKAMRNMVGQV
jgi:phospholipid transport system substrate-binding protein